MYKGQHDPELDLILLQCQLCTHRNKPCYFGPGKVYSNEEGQNFSLNTSLFEDIVPGTILVYLFILGNQSESIQLYSFWTGRK